MKVRESENAQRMANRTIVWRLRAQSQEPAMFFKLFDLIGEEVCNIYKSEMFIVI